MGGKPSLLPNKVFDVPRLHEDRIQSKKIDVNSSKEIVLKLRGKRQSLQLPVNDYLLSFDSKVRTMGMCLKKTQVKKSCKFLCGYINVRLTIYF